MFPRSFQTFWTSFHASFHNNKRFTNIALIRTTSVQFLWLSGVGCPVTGSKDIQKNKDTKMTSPWLLQGRVTASKLVLLLRHVTNVSTGYVRSVFALDLSFPLFVKASPFCALSVGF